MKSFSQYLFEDTLDSIEEITLLREDDAASTTTDGVALPDPVNPPVIKRSKFMGCPVIEVDPDTYCKCIQGKVPFARWAKYVEDENLRDAMRNMFHRNQRMLVVNSSTGAMVYVK